MNKRQTRSGFYCNCYLRPAPQIHRLILATKAHKGTRKEGSWEAEKREAGKLGSQEAMKLKREKPGSSVLWVCCLLRAAKIICVICVICGFNFYMPADHHTQELRAKSKVPGHQRKKLTVDLGHR